MIIGNGLLAKAFSYKFSTCQNTVIFASGVSNSQENNESAFIREKILLENVLQKKFKQIVYFSTCSIYDNELQNTPYIKHKLAMELLVSHAKNYNIFRLPQVVGTTSNSNTLTNFLYNKIIKNEYFEIWGNAIRNIIDVDDVVNIAESIINNNIHNKKILNIASPKSISIIDLVVLFEFILSKNAYYKILDIGGSYDIDTQISNEVAAKIGVNFNDSYIENLIKKYYEK